MLIWIVSAALAASPSFSLRDGGVPVPVSAFALPQGSPPAALTACDVQWRMRPGAEPVRTVTGCEGPWRDAVDAAAAQWKLEPPEAAFADGDAVRHATFYAWPDGKVKVALWATKASDQTPLPEGFVYARQPDATKRFPLEISEELKTGDAPVECRVRLTVDAKGKIRGADAAECPEAMRDRATKTATSWRFEPARIDDAPVPAPYYVTARWMKPVAPPPPPPMAIPEDPKLPEGVAFRVFNGFGRADVTEFALPARFAGSLQYCDAVFNVAPSSTTVVVEGCAGPFAAAVQTAAASWKFASPQILEGQPYAMYRVGFYAFPDGRVVAGLFDVPEADRIHRLPEGVAYADLPGVTSVVNPKYPEGAERITVHCFLAVTLDEKGARVGTKPVACDDPWRAEALAALEKWDFKPAKIEGEKVPYTWRLDVKFEPNPMFP
jgi:hypothetical protein